jgi:hypothetical protein
MRQIETNPIGSVSIGHQLLRRAVLRRTDPRGALRDATDAIDL